MKLEDKIITLLAEEPGLDSGQIAIKTGVSIRAAYDALSSLEKCGRIKYRKDVNTGIMYWRLK